MKVLIFKTYFVIVYFWRQLHQLPDIPCIVGYGIRTPSTQARNNQQKKYFSN